MAIPNAVDVFPPGENDYVFRFFFNLFLHKRNRFSELWIIIERIVIVHSGFIVRREAQINCCGSCESLFDYTTGQAYGQIYFEKEGSFFSSILWPGESLSTALTCQIKASASTSRSIEKASICGKVSKTKKTRVGVSKSHLKSQTPSVTNLYF